MKKIILFALLLASACLFAQMSKDKLPKPGCKNKTKSRRQRDDNTKQGGYGF